MFQDVTEPTKDVGDLESFLDGVVREKLADAELCEKRARAQLVETYVVMSVCVSVSVTDVRILQKKCVEFRHGCHREQHARHDYSG